MTENPIRYVVVGCPRSGTTAVHLAVKGHPQVSALNDEMRISPFFDQGLAAFTFGHEPEAERRRTHRALFDAIASVKATAETQALGLKVCAQSPKQAHMLVDGLRQNFPDAKVVLVDREDLVAQYGSLHNAKRTGVWHSWYPSAGKVQAERRKINRFLFTRYALECLDTLKILRTLEDSHASFVCKYDALEADADRTYEAIFRFIGITPVPITWFMAKKVMPPARDYIANYDELSAALARLREQHARDAIPPVLRQALGATTQAINLWMILGRGAGDAGPG